MNEIVYHLEVFNTFRNQLQSRNPIGPKLFTTQGTLIIPSVCIYSVHVPTDLFKELRTLFSSFHSNGFYSTLWIGSR